MSTLQFISRNSKIVDVKPFECGDNKIGQSEDNESLMLFIEKYNLGITIEDGKIYTYKVIDGKVQPNIRGEFIECHTDIAMAISDYFNVNISDYGLSVANKEHSVCTFPKINIGGIDEKTQRNIADIFIGNKRGEALQEIYRLAKKIKPTKEMREFYKRNSITPKIAKKRKYKNGKRSWFIKNVHSKVNGILKRVMEESEKYSLKFTYKEIKG